MSTMDTETSATTSPVCSATNRVTARWTARPTAAAVARVGLTLAKLDLLVADVYREPGE